MYEETRLLSFSLCDFASGDCQYLKLSNEKCHLSLEEIVWARFNSLKSAALFAHHLL